MAARGAHGTVVLSADEAARLRDDVDRWEQASRQAGADTSGPLVELGCDVRFLLTTLGD